MRPTSKMIPLMVAGGVFTVIIGFILVVLLISWFSNPPRPETPRRSPSSFRTPSTWRRTIFSASSATGT